jgi:hypothetical protein
MVGQSLTVPPPSDDDHEDVAWALRAASAQWRRDDRHDAIAWVRRAAETAIEVGQAIRARELFILAQHLEQGPLPSTFSVSPTSAPPQSIAPPVARLAVAPPMRAPAVAAHQLSADDADLEFEEAVGIDDDDAEIVFDEELETVSPASAGSLSSRAAPSLPSAFPSSLPPRAMPPPATPADSQRHFTPTGRPPAYPSSVPPNPWARSGSSRPPASSQASSLPPLPSLPSPSLPSLASRRTESGPPSSGARGFDTAFLDSLDDEALPRFAPSEPTFDFTEEPPTRQANPPSMVELPVKAMLVQSKLPIDGATAAEYAQRHRGSPLETPEQIERELGVDLSLGSTRPPAQGARRASRDASPTPGRASVQPSRSAAPASSVRGVEPFLMAPSASLPPVRLDPPSRPTQAPPAESMSEPEPHDSQAPAPELDLSGQVGRNRSSLPPPILPPAVDEDDDILAGAFERLQSRPPPNVTPSKAPPPTDAPRQPVPSPHQLDGVELFDVRGLQDLPEDAMAELTRRFRLIALSPGQEVASFGVALVTAGSVQLMPTVADASCARARQGEVVFTRGTVPSSVALRVVAAEPNTRVAVLSDADLDAVTSSCPWVRDELAEVGDRYNAFGGAVLGPLGESLDEMFRAMVLDKCVVKNPAPGSLIAHRRKSMDGLYVLGCGTLLILSEDGRVESELSPGDFVFPETVLSGSPARADVRVAKGGALLLYAGRMAAHELLATCPPFIEILAG